MMIIIKECGNGYIVEWFDHDNKYFRTMIAESLQSVLETVREGETKRRIAVRGNVSEADNDRK